MGGAPSRVPCSASLRAHRALDRSDFLRSARNVRFGRRVWNRNGGRIQGLIVSVKGPLTLPLSRATDSVVLASSDTNGFVKNCVSEARPRSVFAVIGKLSIALIAGLKFWPCEGQRVRN
jgi:hypothetical protein